MTYALSHRAQVNIKEIIRYTHTHFGAAHTHKYLAGLYDSFELLADNPKLGQAGRFLATTAHQCLQAGAS